MFWHPREGAINLMCVCVVGVKVTPPSRWHLGRILTHGPGRTPGRKAQRPGCREQSIAKVDIEVIRVGGDPMRLR